MALINDDFLLRNETAKTLYHGFARGMGIFDYHCHIPPKDIAENRRFENLTQIWLAGDHYKWRAMRANGIDERFITGDASDWEKFQAWADTLPKTVRNPLYQWSYLELDRYFGVRDIVLNRETARSVYDTCSEMLRTEEFAVQNLIRRMNVKVLCTTDDPTDDLQHHKRLREEGFGVKVLPAFRPDRSMAVESPEAFNAWVAKLEKAANIEIWDYASYIAAIRSRHEFFHDAGCRISDHGLETAYAEECGDMEAGAIFAKIHSGQGLDDGEIRKFKSALMVELAAMDARKGWAHQLHFGAIRNVNSRMLAQLGPDTGYDSMGDFELARPLAKFLDRLAASGRLPKTILFNVNPGDNEVLATMAGNFQDSSVAGKMQFGPAWWFLDQQDGMTAQLNALSNVGLLSRFVGMVTDSRSFLSYPRHEYFRRLLCNLLGADVEAGQIFEPIESLGRMVQDICYHNAVRYFGIDAGK